MRSPNTGMPRAFQSRTRLGLARCWVLAAAVLLWLQQFSFAQNAVDIKAFVDRTEIGLNERFRLSVEITGSAAGQVRPAAPSLDGFAALLGSGSTQNFSFVNGRTSVSMIHQFTYEATKEGRHEIPAVEIDHRGRSYRSEPIRITVRPRSGAAGRRPGRRSALGGQGSDAVAQDQLFLRAVPDRLKVYENQPVVVEFKIYTAVSVESYTPVDQPATSGFWAEEFELPRNPETYAENFQGRRYTVATIKKLALFPTGSGSKTIGPMQVECQVRRRGFRSDPFDDFFSSRILGRRRVAVNIASDPIEIEVLPFPEQGRPADFSGIAGRLRVSAKLDKRKAKADEAVTMTLEVSGEGNLRSLSEPRIEFPENFEVYPPKVSNAVRRNQGRIGARRTYEYVLIPRAGGRKTIPPVGLSYFDPADQTYKQASSDELVIDVEGDSNVVVGLAEGRRGEIRQIRQDIRFIKTDSRSLSRSGSVLYASAAFWTVGLAPLAALFAAWGFRRHRDRLQGDVAYARHRRASRLARKRLSAARMVMKPETSSRFYAEAAKALLGFLGDKLNIAEAGLISEDAKEELRRRGVSGSTIDDYFDRLQTCDLKRFSPADAEQAEMAAFLAQAENAMTQLEREIR